MTVTGRFKRLIVGTGLTGTDNGDDTITLAATGSGSVPTTRTITAGSGLTGGGDLSADRTIDANPDGSTLEVSADALRVKDLGITTAKLADAGPGATGPIGDATHTPAVTIDAKGRVTGLTSVAITAGIPQGGPLTTDLAAGSHKITGLTDPGSAQDAATKAYVDAAVGGPGVSVLLYDYTVAGAAKASIDTGVDTPDAGSAGTSAFSGAYHVLEIWVIAQGDNVAIDVGIDVTLNNDTGANYDTAVMSSVGGAAIAAASTPAQSGWPMNTHGTTATTQYPSIHRLTIPGYAGTTFYKTAEYTEAREDATAGNSRVALRANGYRSTSAITRVKLAARTTQKLNVGSRLMIFAR